MKDRVIANQVFIGCPWKQIRPKYINITEELEKRFPLSFILVGRESDQSAEDLLTIIKSKLLSSSSAIFDVTRSNPNVSLEFGIAETSGIQSALYLNTHEANKSKEYDSAIISDLAGKRRKQYKQENALKQLLMVFCKNHPYTTRFEKCISKENLNAGKKKRFKALALKAIHYLDDTEKVRRDDLVQYLEGLQPGDYGRKEIEEMLRSLKKTGLIQISTGRYSEVTVS